MGIVNSSWQWAGLAEISNQIYIEVLVVFGRKLQSRKMVT